MYVLSIGLVYNVGYEVQHRFKGKTRKIDLRMFNVAGRASGGCGDPVGRIKWMVDMGRGHGAGRIRRISNIRRLVGLVYCSRNGF